jgi:hypothetical protein
VEGTVNATLSYVAQAFGSVNRPDPRLDADGRMCFLLQEQFRAYCNQDGSRQKQKALPMLVLRKMMDLAVSNRDKAIAWLLIGAIFFAMQSCEYLKKSTEEKKQTKIIHVGDILFKKNNRVSRHDNPDLHMADLVRIKFCFQKNDKWDVCIHMFRSGDPLLCPVMAWAQTVQRVRKILESNDDSKVCLFQDRNNNTNLIRADHVRSKLRAVVDVLGEVKLGFSKDNIGLHSIHSGRAMAMFLSGTSVIIIMHVGCWSSEAFLEYIRNQVETFTKGVSNRMLEVEDFFMLNMGNQAEESPHVKSNLNEDGQDSMSINVKFNKVSLNSGQEIE